MATKKKSTSKKAASPAAAARAEPTPPPPPPGPPPKTKFAKDELKQFKAHLLSLRDQLSKQVGGMERDALQGADQDVSVDHMADHGSDTFDQDFTLGLIENEEHTIREIDFAIERINDGTFGVCEACVEEPLKLCKTCPHIPKARLDAIPYTRYCVEYARVAERDREIEESRDDEE
jgi:RNA polymerase-binding transcription factor DksA